MSAHPIFDLDRRTGPLLISIPHLGTELPAELRDHYSAAGLTLADTDWYQDRMYAFAESLGATVLRARISRYVIDLNRPATGESLYPGMTTSSLCPTETFRGEPVYAEGCDPDANELARRVTTYWRPYHTALQQELARLRDAHSHVLLWEAHSIASVLPRLFSGKLPDFNFGTSDGESCSDPVIAAAVNEARTSDLSWVLNGRFKGGFITRRYGAPADGIHAIQLEMCQSLYMEEFAPFEWRSDLAGRVRPVVQACVQAALAELQRLPASPRPGHAPILAG